MHVLNVNHTLDPVSGGGTAERTAQMSRFLARSGITCTVLTTGDATGRTDASNMPAVKLVIFPLLWRRFFVPRISLSRLRETIGAADIVHLMGHWSVLNAIVYCMARHLRKPYVVCPAGALPIYGRSQSLKRLYNFVVGKSIVRNASARIAITEDEIAHFAAYGIEPAEVCIIPNGIDASDFKQGDANGPRESLGLGANPFVLFMGRLNRIKGPDLLLEAFCRVHDAFPDWHLVFAGPDDGMLKDLNERTRLAGVVNRVHFAGYVSGPAKVSTYRAATLLAIPSRHEAMSIVVLEAGACDVPVLLTDQCGFKIAAGSGAELVPATVDGITQGLARMLAQPASLAARGRMLGDFVRMHYLWASIGQLYIELYRRLLDTAR